jgi:carbamoyl-phosphate synthase large subunit
MNNITVLITGAGAPGAPGIIKSLRLARERKIKIIGVDMDPDSSGFALVDKWYVGEKADSEKFIARILEICRYEKVDIIIPLVTEELQKFAQSTSEFESIRTRVLISSPEGIQTANNKYLLMESCKEQGMPVSEFYKVNNWNDFEESVYSIGYPTVPVCFKPPISHGLRGFRIITPDIDRSDLLMNYKPIDTFIDLDSVRSTLLKAEPFPELLVMEYLPGKEYSVDVLAGNGEALIVIPRLREKMKMGISFVGITDNHHEIIEYSRRIVNLLRLHGNIGFQFMLDKDGTPKIIECNPRVQGTIVLCTAAGINMVYNAVKIALGEPISDKQEDIRWGVKMIRYWEEVYTYNGKFFKI